MGDHPRPMMATHGSLGHDGLLGPPGPDGGRPLGDLTREGQGTALEMRLVRKPEAGHEAGAAAGC